MIREIFIYACILELKITVSGHICYFVFPLSYRLSTSVSSV